MAKRRPQGDGTIRKRSDGRWEARIIIGHKNDGSPMYKSAFAKTLLDPDIRITRDRGVWVEKKGVFFLPTYHPAALLRDESKKRDAWHDFQAVQAKLAELRGER